MCCLMFNLNECFTLQAVWALGNIAGDSTECRDFVIECNILPSLLQYVATLSYVLISSNK